MDGSSQSWFHFPHFSRSHGHLLWVQSRFHFSIMSKARWQVLGVVTFCYDVHSQQLPEIATSATVHSACVRSNPKNGYDGVILQDKLKTTILGEKIAPLHRIRIMDNPAISAISPWELPVLSNPQKTQTGARKIRLVIIPFSSSLSYERLIQSQNVSTFLQ